MMYRRHNSFGAVWLVMTDVSVEELNLQPTEVVDAKWVTREEIKAMGEKGLLVEYFYIDFLYHLIDEEFGTKWESGASNK